MSCFRRRRFITKVPRFESTRILTCSPASSIVLFSMARMALSYFSSQDWWRDIAGYCPPHQRPQTLSPTYTVICLCCNLLRLAYITQFHAIVLPTLLLPPDYPRGRLLKNTKKDPLPCASLSPQPAPQFSTRNLYHSSLIIHASILVSKLQIPCSVV